jgi:hypothetical protein
VARPPITLTCDCGSRDQVAYGERWTCPDCGKSYDTSRVPRDEYETLVSSVKRYQWLTIGPPLAVAAVLVPAAIFGDIRYAFLLFILVMGYGLLVLPRIRRRARVRAAELRSRWQLEAD